jgi:AraC family transcriptional regulator, regulatory protein of adaptative response / methylated-DNA-[protein]-cysteine methyltransferase
VHVILKDQNNLVEKGLMRARVVYGLAEAPFGICFIAGISGLGVSFRVTHLFFSDQENHLHEINTFAKELKKLFFGHVHEHVRDDDTISRMAEEIFSPFAIPPCIPLLLRGSLFQRKVWNGVINIPFGQTSTYSSLAKDIGHPGSARAVGTALAKNSIAYLIPCHRICTIKGDVGNYRWGNTRKEKMIEWERLQCSKYKFLRTPYQF